MPKTKIPKTKMPLNIVSLLKLYKERFPPSELAAQCNDLSSSNNQLSPQIITLDTPSSSQPPENIFHPDCSVVDAVADAPYPDIPQPFMFHAVNDGFQVEAVADAPYPDTPQACMSQAVDDCFQVEAVADIHYPDTPQAVDDGFQVEAVADIHYPDTPQAGMAQAVDDGFQVEAVAATPYPDTPQAVVSLSAPIQDYLILENEDFFSTFFNDTLSLPSTSSFISTNPVTQKKKHLKKKKKHLKKKHLKKIKWTYFLLQKKIHAKLMTH